MEYTLKSGSRDNFGSKDMAMKLYRRTVFSSNSTLDFDASNASAVGVIESHRPHGPHDGRVEMYLSKE